MALLTPEDGVYVLASGTDTDYSFALLLDF